MTRRIFLTILSVAVATVILFGVPLAIAVDRRNRADAVLELERFGSAAASQVPDGFAVSGDAVRLPVVEPEVHLAVYDAAGQLVAGDGPATADPIVGAVADGTVHDGHVADELVVAIPIVRHDQIVGALRSSELADEASDRTHRTWLAMAGLAALVGLIAAIAALLLSRRLTRPVRRLRDAALRLGDGDFTVTAPMSGVPELDAAASALSTTARRLGDLVERERAFTADASHQLSTPLTSLRLVIEGELTTPRSDPVLALHEALGDVDRLEATVTDLLALARDTPVDRRPVDLAVLLRDREPIWRGGLGRAGRTLSVSVGEQTPRVLVSPAALTTVLDVLVENAVQHGRGAVTVAAVPARAGGARITIADEGHIAGDPEAIFERRSRQATGHGIGLALARSLANAEGARLRLAGGEPSTFEVLIAATVARSPADEPPVS